MNYCTCNIKRVGLLIQLFFLSFCLYAQDSNSFNIGLCGNTYVGKYQYKSKKLHCLNNGNYYFSSFDKNSSKSEFIVTCTNVLTKSQDKLTFKLSPELKLSENTLESNFLVHNEKAYILSFKSLFIFKQRGNVFIQDTTILLNIGFRRIFALDDSSISLVSNYNYNELEKDACVKVYLLSTSDLVLSQVYANERPLGIELSHYVHQNIDMKGNQIIIAHPLKYSVEWGTIVKGKIEKKALVYLDTLDDNLELYKETLESFSVNTPIFHCNSCHFPLLLILSLSLLLVGQTLWSCQ
jgi:hypothetical protein